TRSAKLIMFLTFFRIIPLLLAQQWLPLRFGKSSLFRFAKLSMFFLQVLTESYKTDLCFGFLLLSYTHLPTQDHFPRNRTYLVCPSPQRKTLRHASALPAYFASYSPLLSLFCSLYQPCCLYFYLRSTPLCCKA